jgi:hypothetical protein
MGTLKGTWVCSLCRSGETMGPAQELSQGGESLIHVLCVYLQGRTRGSLLWDSLTPGISQVSGIL